MKKKETLPTLYKKNVQGKIEQWKISVEYVMHYLVRIKQVYGEVGGKQIKKEYPVTKGKNIGKKNETSVEQQARSEAKSKWQKKLDSGYVKSLAAAKAGKVDKSIKGGIPTMNAHRWQKYKNKVEYPVLVQPKIDDERCTATYKNGKFTLWTRARKQWTSCPHIIKALEENFKGEDLRAFTIDGGLYRHRPKVPTAFEELQSAVRTKKPSKASAKVSFYMYDVLDSKNTVKAHIRLRILKRMFLFNVNEKLKIIQSKICNNEKEVEAYFKKCVKAGYEGIMIRDPKATYHHKRTKALLKYKKMKDAEFKIIGVEAGKDKTVMFICIDSKGATFSATMSGDKDENQKYLKNHKLWQNKKLTVQYQTLTGKNKVPLFPVGLRIRKGL